jgi:hypothetical protein
VKAIEGIITALVTPFTADGALDLSALRASVRCSALTPMLMPHQGDEADNPCRTA